MSARPPGRTAARARPRAPAPPPATARGDDARARLAEAGLRLFAQQGFAGTSTRELAEAAGVNVAAISYYFGDKAGLYRAVFLDDSAAPGGELVDFAVPGGELVDFAAPDQPLERALARFFSHFTEPLKQGDRIRLCMKLRFREMLEPTGLWDEELAQAILPMHRALLALLAREVGGSPDDPALQRLAISLAGLGVHLHVGRDIVDQLAPGLVADAAAVDAFQQDLVRYAVALVRAEAARRSAPVGAGR